MVKIELEDVCKSIKRAEVLKNIQVSFEGGRIYGLKGYNGSGKTMLMRMIAGLILPTQGCVKINGKVLGKELTFPDSIGILIENPAFLDAYTGLQNLKILADIKKIITEREMAETLEVVGLDPKDKRKYRKYSLGMKQRLGIAAAVMEHNGILLIDEPTNALDTEGVKMAKELLQKERDRGAAVIMACHDLSILEEICDEIYTIEKGMLKDPICPKPSGKEDT